MGRYLRVPPHLPFSTLAHGRPDYGCDHKPLDFFRRGLTHASRQCCGKHDLEPKIRKPNVSAEQESLHDGD